MSGRVKIKSKDKDKKPKIDVFKVIENRFKNMNELRDLIDMDPRKGLVRIRDGAGFREVERGGCLHRNYLNLLEDEVGYDGRGYAGRTTSPKSAGRAAVFGPAPPIHKGRETRTVNDLLAEKE